MVLYRLRVFFVFYKKNFYKKMSLKNPNTWENVKKTSTLKYLSCNFYKY